MYMRERWESVNLTFDILFNTEFWSWFSRKTVKFISLEKADTLVSLVQNISYYEQDCPKITTNIQLPDFPNVTKVWISCYNNIESDMNRLIIDTILHRNR
jgi:hypothetical protein